jgi:hypothetical protein
MRDDATKAVSGSVLVCIALTSGAMFAMAAQSALHHFGLDLGTVHNDLIVDRVAQSRSAMAWWAWWIVGVSAFFVGPFSVSLARFLAASWWLFRRLRLLLSAATVLGLAAVGHLTPAPLGLDITAGAALGGLVATVAALLSLLGAHSAAAKPKIGRAAAIGHWRRRAGTPVPRPLPWRGGGSVHSGFPARWSYTGHSLVPQPGRPLRTALAGMLAVVVFAAVSTVSGLTVLLEVVAPPAARGLMAWTAPPASVAINQARASAMALASRPAVGTVGEHRNPVLPMSDSELTFAKGYVKRQAAVAAAAKFGPTPKAKVKTASWLKGRRFAAVARNDRARPALRDRHERGSYALYAYNPDAHDRFGYDRHGERRYGGRNSHAGSHRHTGHNHHRYHERYRGYDRFARAG